MILCVHFTLILQNQILIRHKEGSLTFKLFHRDLSKWLPKKDKKENSPEMSVISVILLPLNELERPLTWITQIIPDRLSTHGSLTSSAGRLR